MDRACLCGWLLLAAWSVVTSGSPAPAKRGAGTPLMSSSKDDDVDSYDYEYATPKVQLLFGFDSPARKIQKPCKPGYKPLRGRCRKEVTIQSAGQTTPP